MPTTLSTISNTAITVRWKEPYASDALNRKFSAVTPAGVYRGLRLEVSATDLSVDIAEDSVHSDHVGVFELDTGHSMTYRDTTSNRITLDLSSFSGGEAISIAISSGYTIGTDTAAEFQGYTEVEFDALTSAQRSGLIVLGIVVRSASGVIPSANISHDARTISFLNRASEAVPWNPLIRNGGFELGDTGETFAHASPYWQTAVNNVNFTYGPVDTDSQSGNKSLELSCGVVGTCESSATQVLYTSVIPGKQIRISFYKKAIQLAASSPVGIVRLSFEDKDGGGDTDVDLNFDISAIDGSFIELTGVVSVPASMAVLKTIQVNTTGTYAGTGPCHRIDGVQAWYEVDAEEWLAMNSSLSAEVDTDALIVGNRTLGIDAAKLSFDGSSLTIERRNPSSAEPSLHIFGDEIVAGSSVVDGNIDVGQSLLVGDSQAGTARVVAVVSTSGPEYTLMWESVPLGQAGYRKYVSASGGYAETVNAIWDNATNMWSKDVSNEKAVRTWISLDSVDIEVQAKLVNTWADGAWTSSAYSLRSPEPTTLASPTFDPMHSVSDVEGNSRVVVDHNGFLTGGQSTIIRQNWDGFASPSGWYEGGAGSKSYFTDEIMGTPSALLSAGAGQESYIGTSTMFRAHDDIIVTVELEIHSPDPTGVIMLFGFFRIVNLQENGMYFYRDNAVPGWAARTHLRSYPTVTETLTGITPVANVTQRFRMEWYGANMPGGSRVLFYIDGALVAEHTTNITIAADQMPLFIDIADNGAGAERTMVVGPVVTYRNRRKSDDLL